MKSKKLTGRILPPRPQSDLRKKIQERDRAEEITIAIAQERMARRHFLKTADPMYFTSGDLDEAIAWELRDLTADMTKKEKAALLTLLRDGNNA